MPRQRIHAIHTKKQIEKYGSRQKQTVMMSESDYSSSSEGDEDYVPSGGDESFDELEGAVEDEGPEDLPGLKKKTQKTRQKQTDESSTRRRRGWTALEEVGTGEQQEDAGKDRLAEAMKEEAELKKEQVVKKKADDLWSSFLSDVGQKPKPKSSQSHNGQAGKPSSMTASKSENATGSTSKPSTSETQSTQSNASKSAGTMQITKVFDFAGEEIRVTKEVDAGSKEAKSFLKEKDKEKEDAASGSSSGSSAAALKPPAPSGAKRPGGGLGNILGQIGKKQKISTLEKSRLDWMSFKQSQGIEEELKIHNKGKEGFVERQRFLERTDVRQYEIERNARMSQNKVNR